MRRVVSPLSVFAGRYRTSRPPVKISESSILDILYSFDPQCRNFENYIFTWRPLVRSKDKLSNIIFSGLTFIRPNARGTAARRNMRMILTATLQPQSQTRLLCILFNEGSSVG
ncbi:hypothetical protein AcV7_007510 [Taiwanofungus camphoratus]|nr:hypothetical protein AcV7_007510 [Antrodia cinnamomea]